MNRIILSIIFGLLFGTVCQLVGVKELWQMLLLLTISFGYAVGYAILFRNEFINKGF